MFNCYLEVLKKYAVFQGRARRREYWSFVLVNLIVGAAIGLIDILLGGTGIFVGLYGLAIFIPGLALTIRRLHDVNLSGWWYLIIIVPFGGIVLFVFTVMDTKPGPNRFGP
ncbi:MAG: DUF805 domain-containing protein, partial [Clostridium sp.]